MGSGGVVGKIVSVAAGAVATFYGGPQAGVAAYSAASGLTAKKPKTPSSGALDATTNALKADAAAAKTSRASLFSTDGGIDGQELTADQVSKRGTLLGN